MSSHIVQQGPAAADRLRERLDAAAHRAYTAKTAVHDALWAMAYHQAIETAVEAISGAQSLDQAKEAVLALLGDDTRPEASA